MSGRQCATQRDSETPVEELPPGFKAANGNYSHGFAFVPDFPHKKD
ncbi:MAG: hypothetical protein GKR89_34075 [Candidatus Latescibacteria bacterium]|nr:hypothetical protein [Candidatus Latescibacterota bacterium]